MPVCVEKVKSFTNTNKILSKVITYTRSTWPAVASSEVKDWYEVSKSLCSDNNCLYNADKCEMHVHVVLQEYHDGIVRAKMHTTSSVWWSKIENFVFFCQSSQRFHKQNILRVNGPSSAL